MADIIIKKRFLITISVLTSTNIFIIFMPLDEGVAQLGRATAF